MAIDERSSGSTTGTVHVYCCGDWCGSFGSEADAREFLTTRPDCETYTILEQSEHEQLLAVRSH